MTPPCALEGWSVFVVDSPFGSSVGTLVRPKPEGDRYDGAITARWRGKSPRREGTLHAGKEPWLSQSAVDLGSIHSVRGHTEAQLDRTGRIGIIDS
jgi:hypothetical protein